MKYVSGKPQLSELLVLVCLIAAVAVQAAGQAKKDLSEASLEELTDIQVYSASKRIQSVSQAPSSVTVVTAEDIQKYGYRTLADLLRTIRGFYVTYDRNYSFIGVRGFGRLGDWNSRVLLLVDGHRVNNVVLDQAMLGSEFPVDLDLVERVEIIRGPSSSLYGTDAFFAVINVITRKQPQVHGWELSFAPASFDSYQERMSYGGNLHGLGFMLSGSFYNSQGQTLFFPEFDAPSTGNGITRNTDDENSQHVLTTLTFHGFTFQGMFSAREKGNPTAYFGTVFNDPRTRNFDNHQYFDLSYEHSLGDKWNFTAHTSYDQYRLQAPLVYADGPGGSDFVDIFSARGNWWTTEGKISGTFLHRNKLTFGSEVRDNLRQDQGYYDGDSNIFFPEYVSSVIYALYAQDEVTITHQVMLSAGLRYDHYDLFGGTTNPRLGFIYQPFPHSTLKLLYGTAFRAPDVFEVQPGFGPAYEDNHRLQPETIQSIEGVVEQGLWRHFTLTGSVFHNGIRRLISLESDPSNGQLVYENADKAQATGMEAEFSGSTERGVRATASFTYVDANDDSRSGRKLPNAPRHMGQLNLSVPVVRKRLFASMDAQYLGRRFTLARNNLGSFPVFNATAFGHTLGPHLDLSGSVYNLLNRKYADPGRPEDVEDVIQQNGRSYRIKITARF